MNEGEVYQDAKAAFEAESKEWEKLDVPHIWIQWKGTDVCADVRCTCGNDEDHHVDQSFFYEWKCPSCGKMWAIGCHVQMREILTSERLDTAVRRTHRRS